ncbi:MAG: Tad domain-containing protein [Hellea sp.]|nr:Tad domain-containing protein [Hellea sp.]
MAIWAVLAMPVFIAGAALSVDVSRMYNLEHELQIGADALAKAGAAELDQRSDSIIRSNRAIANLVENNQKFSENGAGEVTTQSVRYLTDLPDNDYEIPGTELETTDPYQARYVEVNVSPETVKVLFSRKLADSISSATLEATSIAGTGNGVCGAAPLFVCNPYEGTGTSIYEAMETQEFQRQLIQFKTTTKNNDPYGPGNFGFLDPYGNGDNSKIDEAIAINKPAVCFSKAQGVNLETGNIASLRVALNTRFDMYEGKFKQKKTDADYAPAANVTKGFSGNNCNSSPDPNAMALPRDKCFYDDSCPNMNGRQGDGDWDMVSYFEINHNAAKKVTIEGQQYNLNFNARKVTPKNKLPSRYQVYRWEIDTGSIPGKVSYGNSSTPEEGTPQCHASGASSSPFDRRIMYAAVMNCVEVEAQYGLNGSQKNLPVETFVKVFVTEPMGKGHNNMIWGEIVGPIVKGKDPGATDQVSVSR